MYIVFYILIIIYYIIGISYYLYYDLNHKRKYKIEEEYDSNSNLTKDIEENNGLTEKLI